MKSNNVDQQFVQHLQELQVWNRLRPVVEKVNAVKEVVEVDQLELTSWALDSKKSKAENSSPQNKDHVVANRESISCADRFVKGSIFVLELV